MQRICSVKESEDLIQQACDITAEKGFRRILNFVKPNIMEVKLKLNFLKEFLRNRSKGFTYTHYIVSEIMLMFYH
jgi:Xaa-Pro aminopeptidase